MRAAVVSAVVAVSMLAAVQPAAAVLVASGSSSLTESSPLQVGRILRNGVASSWAVPKTWPGFNDESVTRRYESFAINFAPNATQNVYYRLTLEQPSTQVFGVAYNGAYNPADQPLNYVGDPGASSPSAIWEVIVPTGGALSLVVLEVTPTAGDLGFSYTIEAFSNASGGENFGTVPEPASWAMMIAGFGLVGAAARRRRQPVLARAV